MFTGIVQDLCEVVGVEDRNGVRRLRVRLGERADGLELGASVANNGVCLTATAIDGGIVDFDVIAETVQLTNLRDIEPGSSLNIERSLRFGDELGGHILSGHVSGTITVSRICWSDRNSPGTRTGFSLRPSSMLPAGRSRFASRIAPSTAPKGRPNALIRSGSSSTRTSRSYPPQRSTCATPGTRAKR